MENGDTRCRTRYQWQAVQHGSAGLAAADGASFVDQAGIGDQFRKHHRGRLQCLDLDFGIFARLGVLDREHAHRPFGTDDRHTGKAVKAFFSRLGHISECRMRGSFIEVQRFDIVGNRSNKSFAKAQFGDVHSVLIQTARCKKFENTIAQQIDRANLTRQRLTDDIDHLVQLCLRVISRSHHFVKAGQYVACGYGCAFHATRLADGMGARDTRYRLAAKNYVCSRV